MWMIHMQSESGLRFLESASATRIEAVLIYARRKYTPHFGESLVVSRQAPDIEKRRVILHPRTREENHAAWRALRTAEVLMLGGLMRARAKAARAMRAR